MNSRYEVLLMTRPSYLRLYHRTTAKLRPIEKSLANITPFHYPDIMDADPTMPSYLTLFRSGELERRADLLEDFLTECRLCPRRCGARRTEGQVGTCRAGLLPMVSSAFPHFGEEPELVGRHGSGTIFMTHCNLRCVFCQNDDISHGGAGQEVSSEELAGYMVALGERGCHNINFVTPTQWVPQIVRALLVAVPMGLSVPLVYNTGGYDSVEVIGLLSGIFDIYMPDYKFSDEAPAKKYLNASDYPEVIKAVLSEMHRQVGNLATDRRGVAYRGLLIRHLVMPEGLGGTEAAMRFIARELSPDSYVNIMDQYRPECRAYQYPELSRPIGWAEYAEAARLAREAGLSRGF
jgi:putative pyruvate formate lyase activating enzyme